MYANIFILQHKADFHLKPVIGILRHKPALRKKNMSRLSGHGTIKIYRSLFECLSDSGCNFHFEDEIVVDHVIAKVLEKLT